MATENDFGWRKILGGGESVSQPPLKDKHFRPSSTETHHLSYGPHSARQKRVPLIDNANKRPAKQIAVVPLTLPVLGNPIAGWPKL
jgi:hypothetical protein